MADSEALKARGLQGQCRMASLSSSDMYLHITPIMNKATGNHVQLPAWAMMYFFFEHHVEFTSTKSIKKTENQAPFKLTSLISMVSIKSKMY